jgi:hypothetical protein
METSMTKAMAVSTVGDICTRPRRGANTAHAVTLRSVQGRSVSFAGGNDGRDLQVAGYRTAVVDAIAPITGVVCPRLEAPPV